MCHFFADTALSPSVIFVPPSRQNAQTVLIYASLPTPVGTCWLAAEEAGVAMLSFAAKPEEFLAEVERRYGGAMVQAGDPPFAAQVRSTLAGRVSDPVPLCLSGTSFQLQVWRALASLPQGTTISYQELAARMGRPRAVRAVATAVGQNPVAILLPCHRVVRADGSLGGYHWGLERKRALLEGEGANKKAS